ncbi:hypothetical protein [Neolewinella persica]|uniref:hypothetical protein n=1 Tax=Neolewinella persica TaxID=70998 RepID=UPI0003A92F4C|nr:hypothetical protein [Neolewinella persica]
MRIICFCLLTALVSCVTPDSSGEDHPGIYYWKTTWELNPERQAELRAAGTRQLFVRFFDVDWNFNQGQAQPKGILQLPDSLVVDETLAITPVVYVVERVFRQPVDAEELAQRIGRTIEGMSAGHAALRAATRWQIDCDWTPTSRDRYFAFLRALQTQFPDKVINVTIRLHQYREREDNGVPPVSEGLLMCYNMEPVGEPETQNAIYREDLLRGYLKAPPYPIPLDAALPVFAWGAAFRDDLFLGVVSPPAASPGFLDPVGGNRFLVLKDTTLLETFVRPGDDVRYDGANTAALLTAAGLLRDRNEIRDLILFDWRMDVLENWPLAEVWTAFY